MAEETGPEAFLRQQRGDHGRPDSRPGLAAIACPTLVLVGDGDELTPPALSQEIAAGHSRARGSSSFPTAGICRRSSGRRR